MPEFQLPVIRTEQDIKTLSNMVAQLQKELYWLLNSLDSLNIKSLTTELTTITSEDGNTILNGTQIIMKDENGTTRLIMGLDKDANEFVFTLFDENGDVSIELDSNGDAIFRGTITTSKNAVVGNILQIGEVLGNGGILFGPSGFGAPTIDYTASALTIFAQSNIAIDTNGDLDLNGDIKTFGQTAVSLGTFTTNDGKTVTVRNGIITSIV